MFPEFGGQDEFASFLKTPYEQEGTTKSLLKHKTSQDDENSALVAFEEDWSNGQQ